MNKTEGNYLIINENGESKTIDLDKKIKWEIGRKTPDSKPDIMLSTHTVSRMHGVLINISDVWFYYDKKRKNSTFINGSPIKPGIGGRIRPVMLSDGDEIILGGGKKAELNEKTVLLKYCRRTES